MGQALKKPESLGIQATLIVEERRVLLERLAALERANALREHGQLTGDNTPTSDVLDTVQEGMAKEEAHAHREALIQRLRELDRAEDKIREGTYGICEACGQPIPAARLRAVPEATRCVPCAEREERRILRAI